MQKKKKAIKNKSQRKGLTFKETFAIFDSYGVTNTHDILIIMGVGAMKRATGVDILNFIGKTSLSPTRVNQRARNLADSFKSSKYPGKKLFKVVGKEKITVGQGRTIYSLTKRGEKLYNEINASK